MGLTGDGQRHHVNEVLEGEQQGLTRPEGIKEGTMTTHLTGLEN